MRPTVALVVVALAALLAGCQSAPRASVGSAASATTAVDDGTELTLWTRLAADSSLGRLVTRYNATHRNRVELTSVPGDSYLQKVGAAAGSGALPDLLATDVVHASGLASKNVLLDLTRRVGSLPYGDRLAPGPVDASTVDGKLYAIPAVLDVSALFYNKVLYEKAGLDPDQPPTTLTEEVAQANKIHALGDGVSGSYFAGNCPGCAMFTGWPSIWADGEEPLGADGSSARLDSAPSRAWLRTWHGLYDDGVVPTAARQENGATWTAAFQAGTVGLQRFGALGYATLQQNDKLRIGVTGIPGSGGKQSAYVGGDVMGISTTSGKAAQAWDFLKWTMSEQAQVGVVAKSGALPVRTDLADNRHSAADPNIVELNRLVATGHTPSSPAFGQVFTDPNGPWHKLFRDAVFSGADAETLAEDNRAITTALKIGG
ncbi:ABC transporter substrate-binding protein [Streptomyces sp. enrichment culture]|uniref:ABC transporter substrate-binding protein n=1 Tax=Streptomyces sp. enrichment culture TaxID=1795815 RepID=UPI003F54DA8B